MLQSTQRFDKVLNLIKSQGEILREARLGKKETQSKSDPRDLVTKWDRATEQALRQGILSSFPEDTIVGEEFPKSGNGSGTVWYIDPIDGTTNFVSMGRDFAISVGCYVDGKPEFGIVLDVAADTVYWAADGMGAYRNDERVYTAKREKVEEQLLLMPGIPHTLFGTHPNREKLARLCTDVRGVRSRGSVALELCAVACGEGDLFATARSCPWDHNAARIILEEAGGALCTLEGENLPFDEKTTVFAASSPQILERTIQTYGLRAQKMQHLEDSLTKN